MLPKVMMVDDIQGFAACLLSVSFGGDV